MNVAKTTNQRLIEKLRLHESYRNNFGYGGGPDSLKFRTKLILTQKIHTVPAPLAVALD